MTFERLEGQGAVEVDLLPTEDVKKVLEAIARIFPNSKLSERDGKMIGSVDLSFFKQLVEKEDIKTVVEALLDKNLSGQRSYIDLNKMAACAGRIGMEEDSPIGKIRLHVDWKSIILLKSTL